MCHCDTFSRNVYDVASVSKVTLKLGRSGRGQGVKAVLGNVLDSIEHLDSQVKEFLGTACGLSRHMRS